MTFFSLLLQKSILLIVLGIVAQWIAWRMRMPAIVLLSAVGILAGPVFNWLEPTKDFGEALEVMIKLAVAVILFEGGLNLKISELKQAGSGVGRLVLLGLPLSWVLATLSAYYIAGLSFPVSSIIGAILVVTGPTVIMPLLRQIKLTPRVSSLMKWEGVVNDPLGVLLAVFIFEYYLTATSPVFFSDIALHIGGPILVAIGLGVGAGFFIKYTFHRDMCPEFLKVPVILCFILLIYGAANWVQDEAGLLSVTVFGFTLCNVGLGIIYELRRFKEYISIFLLSTVFIVLTASLTPEHLYALNWRSVLFLAAILFIVRPLSVWLATVGGDLTWKERLLVGWIAPRGVIAVSVAGLFAPALIEQGYAGAELLTPLIFAVVFLTVTVHGLSLNRIAKGLGLSAEKPKGVLIVGASPWTTELALLLKKQKFPVLLVDHAWHKLQEARYKNIPVYDGEILSDATEAFLDLSEMGYLLSATENDAYNALVCNAFKNEFGNKHVFQLSMHRQGRDMQGRKQVATVKNTNRGKILFGQHFKYEQILEKYFQGWRFKELAIGEKFKFNEFLRKYKDKAVPLFTISKNQHLIFNLPEQSIKKISQGDKLFCFVYPDFKVESPT